jgi:Tol biopolymer transport system component
MNGRTVAVNQASDTSPAWSPEGTRTAFEIYVMNADGSDVTGVE